MSPSLIPARGNFSLTASITKFMLPLKIGMPSAWASSRPRLSKRTQL